LKEYCENKSSWHTDVDEGPCLNKKQTEKRLKLQDNIPYTIVPSIHKIQHIKSSAKGADIEQLYFNLKAHFPKSQAITSVSSNQVDEVTKHKNKLNLK